MGQYYTAYVVDDNGHVKSFSPHNIGCGAKLTENGYLSSPFVNSVLREILNAPKRVAWVGDYIDCIENKELISRIKNYIKVDYGTDCFPQPLNFKNIEDYAGWYLLNHDKKECINISKFVNKNARIMIGEYELADGQKKKDLDIFCMSPLALLTACGNGYGCGDYKGTDESEVGRWALDRIEFRKGSEAYAFNPMYHGYTLKIGRASCRERVCTCV